MLNKSGLKDTIKNLIIIFCILCLALLGLCIALLRNSYISSNEQRSFLQNGANRIFEYNFSALCSNLNVDTSGMNEDELDYYNNENVKYGYAITSIFSYTKYTGDTNLNKIVFAMSQMVGVDAIYGKMSEPRILEQLKYLSLHLDSQEVSKPLWEQLSVLLKTRGL